MHPGDLIVVRGRLYDPRIFYLCHVRGWVLDQMNDDPSPIPDHIKHGARYFVDAEADPKSVKLRDWLEHNARRVDAGATMNPPRESGQIWELRPGPATL